MEPLLEQAHQMVLAPRGFAKRDFKLGRCNRFAATLVLKQRDIGRERHQRYADLALRRSFAGQVTLVHIRFRR
jgi:hypothetical protein